MWAFVYGGSLGVGVKGSATGALDAAQRVGFLARNRHGTFADVASINKPVAMGQYLC